MPKRKFKIKTKCLKCERETALRTKRNGKNARTNRKILKKSVAKIKLSTLHTCFVRNYNREQEFILQILFTLAPNYNMLSTSKFQSSNLDMESDTFMVMTLIPQVDFLPY